MDSGREVLLFDRTFKAGQPTLLGPDLLQKSSLGFTGTRNSFSSTAIVGRQAASLPITAGRPPRHDLGQPRLTQKEGLSITF
eukprot:1127443-Amphidinium_carterae.1